MINSYYPEAIVLECEMSLVRGDQERIKKKGLGEDKTLKTLWGSGRYSIIDVVQVKKKTD